MTEAAIKIVRDAPNVPDRNGRQHKYTLYAELSATSNKSWLVRDLLGEAEASAVYGAPGSGKSALVEDMALHIAAHREWHGRPVKGGAVVYVALERRKLVERRAIAFRNKHSLADLPFAICGGIHDLRDPREVQTIIDTVAAVANETGTPVVLVVIDTLSRALAGGDENSPKDMGAIVNATSRLQIATKAHVLWVHHIPHESDRMRGHGALLGAMDTTLSVVKREHARFATVAKANDSEEGASVAFILESVVIGDDGSTAPVVVPANELGPTSSAGPRLTKNQQTMFAILHSAGDRGLTLDAWNDKTREAGIGTSRRADLIDIRMALQSKGLIYEHINGWAVKR